MMKTKVVSETKPWDNEPDNEEFEHEGFHCQVKRHFTKRLIASIAIPFNHPWFDKRAFKIDENLFERFDSVPEHWPVLHRWFVYYGDGKFDVINIPHDFSLYQSFADVKVILMKTAEQVKKERRKT
jgi:hypothetical protein